MAGVTLLHLRSSPQAKRSEPEWSPRGGHCTSAIRAAPALPRHNPASGLGVQGQQARRRCAPPGCFRVSRSWPHRRDSSRMTREQHFLTIGAFLLLLLFCVMLSAEAVWMGPAQRGRDDRKVTTKEVSRDDPLRDVWNR